MKLILICVRSMTRVLCDVGFVWRGVLLGALVLRHAISKN